MSSTRAPTVRFDRVRYKSKFDWKKAFVLFRSRYFNLSAQLMFDRSQKIQRFESAFENLKVFREVRY